MKTVGLLVGLLLLAHSWDSHAAQATPPTLFRVYGTECAYSNHAAQGPSSTDGSRAFGGGIVSGVFGGLIDKGFDLLLAAIKAAGDEKTGRAEGYSAIELLGSKDKAARLPACLQLVRQRVGEAGPVPKAKCADPLQPDELFIELELHLSSDAKAIALRPTCARIEKPIVKGAGEREYVLLAGLLGPRKTGGLGDDGTVMANDDAAIGMLILGRVPTGRPVKYHEDAPLSPWFPFTYPETKKPFTLIVSAIETKRASAFLQALAAALEGQKGAITSAVKAGFSDAEREKLQKAQNALLRTYNDKKAGFVAARLALQPACTAGAPFPANAYVLAKAVANAWLEWSDAALDAGRDVDADPAFQTTPGNDAQFTSYCALP